MKQTAAALALGVLIGMGIGPALAGAYSTDPPQDSTRALQDNHYDTTQAAPKGKPLTLPRP